MADDKLDLTTLMDPYENWVQSQDVPVHAGYYVEDIRTLQLGWWEERQCHAAFLRLTGQEGISEARVTEIPPGKTLPPLKFALDEVVYVADGRGVTTVWGEEGEAKKSFEWQKHSMFLLPRNSYRQLSNMQGNSPARLLHYNYLPVAMSVTPEPEFFFHNSYPANFGRSNGHDEEFYSQAQRIQGGLGGFTNRDIWYGNFFPDMRSWDKLNAQTGRGGGSKVVHIRFPGATVCSHMSVFPAQSYKKAHRHGPGVVIVIPAGEGYSIMWQEGKEKVVIPWHEGSVLVPPNRWFHQHFNVTSGAARYLALRTPRGLSGYSERVEDRKRDQIEYPNEEPWIREKFAEELSRKELKSLMPQEAYQDVDFEWNYQTG